MATITNMRASIEKIHKELYDTIEELIGGYDHKSECPHLCAAAEAVRVAADHNELMFERMNDELYLHLEG